MTDKRIYHECEVRFEKFTQRITVWHHEAFRGSPYGSTRLAKWWQTVILMDGFLPPSHDFSCSPLNTAFMFKQKALRRSWIRWDATWYDDVTWRLCFLCLYMYGLPGVLNGHGAICRPSALNNYMPLQKAVFFTPPGPNQCYCVEIHVWSPFKGQL